MIDTLSAREPVKPTPVEPPRGLGLAFALRQLGDLQLKTIVDFLRPRLKGLQGRVLDVGAGNSPWRQFLTTGAQYNGLDIESANTFGMLTQSDVTYFDGGVFPFPDASFDHALSCEVLEHVENPTLSLSEIARVLKPGGTLILTMPFSARLHHLPHDFRRYTAEGLRHQLAAAGFDVVTLDPRGNDICAIANKLIVLAARSPGAGPAGWLAGLIALVASPFLLALAHLSLLVNMGGNEDPLGYAVVARKPAAMRKTTS